jgi:peptide-methionine (S)-S-oxide reductase
MTESDHEIATLGGGCFWCIEAALKELDGVSTVTSGYCGGHEDDPSYEAVCRGTTGHAEVVRVTYDPNVIAYEDLLAVFFRIHDPTTEDREGPDVGSQYRSAVFYHTDHQRETVTEFIDRLADSGAFQSYENDEIVTEIAPMEEFWEAEEYHQDYYEKQRTADGNTNDAYCAMYAEPKVQKVREKFADKVTPEAEPDA